MPFPHFNPVIFQIGPFALRWYALAYIAGILLGWRYGVRLVRNAKLWGAKTPTATVAQVDDLVLWITLGVIIGGRLGYILFYMLPSHEERQLLAQNPLEAFELWHGGMSFHGGVIGVALALIAFARVNRIDLIALADLVAPCQPIGQFFGRIANFINGELWGRPTTLPWGMIFPSDPQHVPRHPSQLYEAALEGVLIFLVLRFATHRLHWLQRRGAVLGLFLILYGLIRILLETVRNPDLTMPVFPFGLTMGMMLSAPMVIAGAGFLWWSLRQTPAPDQPPHEPARAAEG
ncbi:MAG TPA: prolipoprotein diacylglyceryl transferase [Caulobacteraceae bacterium]|nr:prolipoprotein diacylglyceryl transferase [Caulobacteraceae bacterium]